MTDVVALVDQAIEDAFKRGSQQADAHLVEALAQIRDLTHSSTARPDFVVRNQAFAIATRALGGALGRAAFEVMVK